MADEVIRDVLQENYDILCENLDASSLVNKMFTKRLLTDYEKMEISEGSFTKLARNEKLIDSLMRRGPNGFYCFCDILESSTNPSTVALGRGLREVSETPSDSPKRLHDDWNQHTMSDAPEQLNLGKNADEVPLIKDLVRLNIQEEWYDLGLQLDVDVETLDSIRYNHPHDIRSLRVEMLKAWLTESANNATWRALLKALGSIGPTKVNVHDLVKEHKLDS